MNTGAEVFSVSLPAQFPYCSILSKVSATLSELVLYTSSSSSWYNVGAFGTTAPPGVCQHDCLNKTKINSQNIFCRKCKSLSRIKYYFLLPQVVTLLLPPTIKSLIAKYAPSSSQNANEILWKKAKTIYQTLLDLKWYSWKKIPVLCFVSCALIGHVIDWCAHNHTRQCLFA